MASSSEKKTKGRQKIEMKMIENPEDRLVTFSKRRSGIYKKLSEISTLCGSEFLFICFSPAGNPFSFGHPSIETIANRFMNRNVPMNDNNNTLVEVHRMMKINELNEKYNEIESQLEVAKQEEKEHDQQTCGMTNHYWWEKQINQLNLRELEELESRHAMFLNELYVTRNKKIADIEVSTPMGHAQFNPFIATSSMPAQFTRPFIASSSTPALMDPTQCTNPFTVSSSTSAPMDPALFNEFTNISSMHVAMDPSQLNPSNESSLLPAPMNPSHFNLYDTSANEDASPAFPPGHNHSPRQF